MACPNIVTAYFFARKCKIPFHRKASAMFCRPAPFSGRLRGKVIKDRVIPCIPNQAKVLVFIHDRNQIPFCVAAVTQEDDIFLFRQLRHDLPYHGSGKFQLGLFFLPHPVGKRQCLANNSVFVSHWHAEHDAYKAVPIKVAAAMMRGMVEEF